MNIYSKVTMKRLLYLLLLLPQLANAQKEEISMKPILTDAGNYAKKIEMELGQEIVRMEFDLIQDSKSTFRTLIDEFEYGILAFGDFRIADIDIKVYKWVNHQWNLIEKDESQNGNALVTIKPLTSGDYRIDIIAAKFVDDNEIGHYGLIIYHP